LFHFVCIYDEQLAVSANALIYIRRYSLKKTAPVNQPFSIILFQPACGKQVVVSTIRFLIFLKRLCFSFFDCSSDNTPAKLQRIKTHSPQLASS